MIRRLVLLFLFMSASAHAESRVFTELRERYSKLRNNDSQVQRNDEREVLAAQLSRASEKSLKGNEAAQSLLMAASLKSDQSGEEPARSALTYLKKLQKLFPGSPLEDDAMLEEVKLYLRLHDTDSARQTSEALRTQFPRSELGPLSRALIEAAVTGAPAPTARAVTRADVVIDPGHGGEDFGAVGVGGLMEKDVTLAISRLVVEQLKSHGISAALTRSKDEFLPLAERTARANAAQAKLFVSIHANASVHRTMRGIETYTLDNSGDSAAHLLADRENSADVRGAGDQNGDISFILSDLIQSGKSPEADRLAQVVHSAVVERLSTAQLSPPDLGVKKAPFYVLVGTHMPSILIEVAFIDHAEEGKHLAAASFRQAVAEGIAQGIEKALRSNS